MKHICKILSAILALTLILTSNIVPAMACTLEGADPTQGAFTITDEDLDENGNPIVIPCDAVKEKGYCPTMKAFVWTTGDGEYHCYTNPYAYPSSNYPTKDTDDVADDDNPVETAPVETAPVETQPIETEPTQRFADVARGAWYYNAVNTMGLNGILNGYPDGLFHPDDYMTEAEMLTVIYRLATSEEPWSTTENSNHWAANIVVSLNSPRVSAGYTAIGLAQADDYVNRGEAVTAIIALLQDAGRMEKHGNGTTLTYTSNYYPQLHNWTCEDNDIPDWDIIEARQPDADSYMHRWIPARIVAAYNYGLVSGKDTAGTFDPAGHLTRAEFCQMLYNANITECLECLHVVQYSGG